MISRSAIDLILQFEVGNKNYYNKFLFRPSYRGTGIIIGIGYDLGDTYKTQLIDDWDGNINPNYFPLLFRVLGLNGNPAKQMLTSDLLKVNIPYLNAYEVFIKRTIPRGYSMAKFIYPHLDDLNANTRGALVSLVLSRGNRLEGEDKAEMREIIDFTRNRDYEGIADALERSKRHFEEKGLDDQVKRREAEADLVLSSLY